MSDPFTTEVSQSNHALQIETADIRGLESDCRTTISTEFSKLLKPQKAIPWHD